MRQTRGGRRLIGLASPSMHMHVLLADARARRQDMEELTHLAPSISAAHRARVSSREYDEYGSLAQVHRIRRDRNEMLRYEKLQGQMEEATERSADALSMAVPSVASFDLEHIEEELRERVGKPCLRRPMPGDGVYDLCLLSNATHANYNFGELTESGRTPNLHTRLLGSYSGSVRGTDTESGGPAIVQFYENGAPCGTPPQPSSTRVHLYCGRRLALMRAEQREPCVYRMNVSLPLLCSDEQARSQPLDLPKCAPSPEPSPSLSAFHLCPSPIPLVSRRASKYYNYEKMPQNRPKSAWDRLMDGTDGYLTGPVLGPAYYAALPPIR